MADNTSPPAPPPPPPCNLWRLVISVSGPPAAVANLIRSRPNSLGGDWAFTCCDRFFWADNDLNVSFFYTGRAPHPAEAWESSRELFTGADINIRGARWYIPLVYS